MKDFLSIKEFSELSGIEPTTLRYWDDIGLFSPEKRDPDNGYRYYSPLQIIAVNFVTVLRNLGISLKAISQIEGTREPDTVMNLVEQQEFLLDKEIRKLQEAHSVIHTRRALIQAGQRADVSQISVDNLPERMLILGPPNEEFQEAGDFFPPFIDFCNHADTLRINLNYPIGGYYTGLETFCAAPAEPQRFFSWDPNGNTARKAGEYMVAYSYGHYGDFDDAPQRMSAYAQKHNLTCKGPVYCIYLFDEVSTKDPSRYLSQISVEVSRKKKH